MNFYNPLYFTFTDSYNFLLLENDYKLSFSNSIKCILIINFTHSIFIIFNKNKGIFIFKIHYTDYFHKIDNFISKCYSLKIINEYDDINFYCLLKPGTSLEFKCYIDYIYSMFYTFNIYHKNKINIYEIDNCNNFMININGDILINFYDNYDDYYLFYPIIYEKFDNIDKIIGSKSEYLTLNKNIEKIHKEVKKYKFN